MFHTNYPNKDTGMSQFNDFISSVKSFTNALKNRGDKTHPCFNPVFTSNHSL